MPVEFSTASALAPLLGGSVIGLSASLLLLVEGRVTGISGIVGGLLAPRPGDVAWRAAFLAGLAGAGLVAAQFAPAHLGVPEGATGWTLSLAGLLVGFGTRLGNGCTSGHGVCGLSRGSRRSLASVVTFMGVGALVAVVASALRGAA